MYTASPERAAPLSVSYTLTVNRNVLEDQPIIEQYRSYSVRHFHSTRLSSEGMLQLLFPQLKKYKELFLLPKTTVAVKSFSPYTIYQGLILTASTCGTVFFLLLFY